MTRGQWARVRWGQGWRRSASGWYAQTYHKEWENNNWRTKQRRGIETSRANHRSHVKDQGIVASHTFGWKQNFEMLQKLIRGKQTKWWSRDRRNWTPNLKKLKGDPVRVIVAIHQNVAKFDPFRPLNSNSDSLSLSWLWLSSVIQMHVGVASGLRPCHISQALRIQWICTWWERYAVIYFAPLSNLAGRSDSIEVNGTFHAFKCLARVQYVR